MKKIIVALMLAMVVGTGVSRGVEKRIMTRWGEELDCENVWNVYPRPAFERGRWMNLNGEWDYAIVPAASAQPAAWDGKILVPFTVESALSGVGRRVGDENELWYTRRFDVPAEWAGQDVMLNFGGVDWRCDVWVNGTRVGGHEGAYTPFGLDVTDALKAGGDNELVVRVFDPTDYGYQPRGKQVTEPDGIWYTPVTGIWQTVWLEPVPKARLESVKITPDVDRRVVRVEPRVNTAGMQVSVDVKDGDRTVATATGDGGVIEVAMPADMKLWTPDTPNVYDLEITLLKDGKPVDRVKSYTAMRKISTGTGKDGVKRLKLNDKDIFQLGPLDQGWWPDGLYTAPSYEALISDIDLTKRLGFNMIRKHIKTEPAVWYEYCDRAGVLVWQDMPSSEKPGPWQTRKYYEGTEQERSAESEAAHRSEWQAIIDYLYNEPCVAVWVPFNEGWGQFATVDIAEWTKVYDPTRLVNPASGGNFFHTGDIHDVHHYPDPVVTLVSDESVNVLGEYGGIGLVVPGHLWNEGGDENWGYVKYETPEQVTDEYVNYIGKLTELARRLYAGAVYTQTSDVENEVNGLTTYDRKVVKVDAERVARANRELIREMSEE